VTLQRSWPFCSYLATSRPYEIASRCPCRWIYFVNIQLNVPEGTEGAVVGLTEPLSNPLLPLADKDRGGAYANDVGQLVGPTGGCGGGTGLPAKAP
jgi:hypothetical protein